MSFFTTGLGAAAAVKGLLDGPAVSIGGVDLAGMEVPATMPFGGTQATVVHDLPGGGRVVDTMGAHDRDADWSGTFLGVSAVSRARSLDQLRISGKAVVLNWADFRKTVVVKSFEAEYGYAGGMVPYRISCVVLPQPRSLAKPGLLEQLKADLNSAAGFDVEAKANQAVALAQKALPVAAVMTRGSPAFFAMSSAVGTAAGAVGAASALANSALVNQAATALSSGTTFGGMAGLQAASAAQTVVAQATNAAAFVGRAAANLRGA